MIIVTGGSGFIGKAIVEMVRERGEAVRVVDLIPYPDESVETLLVDLRDAEAVRQAFAGAETVFHCASFIHYGLGRPQHVIDINVGGAKNVVAACKANGIGKLIYTSSGEAMLSYEMSVADGDESLPYPTKFASLYGETKATAEQYILGSSGEDGLLTCAIRPNGVYGEGDIHQSNAIMDFIRQKRFTRIGNSSARALQGYVQNVAHAHLLAADRLTEGSPVCGQAYFIGDGEPHNHFDFFMDIVRAMGITLPTTTIPLWAAQFIARSSETAWNTLPQGWMAEPLLNRHTIAATALDQCYRLDKVRRDLGYVPLFSYEEAIQRTAADIRERFADELRTLGY